MGLSLKNKKIIAKEFLILTLSLFILLISYLSILIYNYTIDKKITKINNVYNHKYTIADSLCYNYKTKSEEQHKFLRTLDSELSNSISKMKSKEIVEQWNILYKLAKNDSIEYRWNHKWDKNQIYFINQYGIKTSKEFKEYILKNIVTKEDYRNYNEGKKIKFNIANTLLLEKKNLIRGKFDIKETISFLSKVLIISFIILFVLRYIYYALKWSIIILKKQGIE